jgi:hypothetical protein
MYIYLAFGIFVMAIFLVLLSYTPWIQENIKWMTNLYFYIVVGLLLGLALLLAAYHLAKNIILIN